MREESEDLSTKKEISPTGSRTQVSRACSHLR